MLCHTCLRRSQVWMETTHPVQFLVKPSQILVNPSKVLTPIERCLPVTRVQVNNLVKLRHISYNQSRQSHMNSIQTMRQRNRKTLQEFGRTVKCIEETVKQISDSLQYVEQVTQRRVASQASLSPVATSPALPRDSASCCFKGKSGSIRYTSA